MGREGIRGEDKVPMALHLWLTSISATDPNSLKKNIHPFYSAISLCVSLSFNFRGRGELPGERGWGGCALSSVLLGPYIK
jgi:hypothetical protein